ncbi:MAG: hypothetical protein K0S60_82 [Evtepia sp.]|jgi:hypothetical protein|nr:hypothetical protein [Evtepia sp.]
MKKLKNMKKRNKITLICLGALLSLYIIPSLYVSAKVFAIERYSFHNSGQNNPYKEIVSDEIYNKMSRRDGYLYITDQNPTVTEHKRTSFPITYFWDGEAKTIYWYSKDVYDAQGKNISGSRNVPVHITLQLLNRKWVITDFYEHP